MRGVRGGYCDTPQMRILFLLIRVVPVSDISESTRGGSYPPNGGIYPPIGGTFGQKEHSDWPHLYCAGGTYREGYSH